MDTVPANIQQQYQAHPWPHKHIFMSKVQHKDSGYIHPTKVPDIQKKSLVQCLHWINLTWYILYHHWKQQHQVFWCQKWIPFKVHQICPWQTIYGTRVNNPQQLTKAYQIHQPEANKTVYKIFHIIEPKTTNIHQMTCSIPRRTFFLHAILFQWITKF